LKFTGNFSSYSVDKQTGLECGSLTWQGASLKLFTASLEFFPSLGESFVGLLIAYKALD